jgi:hypothetical protein
MLALTFCSLVLIFLIWRTALQYRNSSWASQNDTESSSQHETHIIGALVYIDEGGPVPVATAPTEKAAGTMHSLDGLPPDDSDIRVLDPRIRHPIFVYTLTPRPDQVGCDPYDSTFQMTLVSRQDTDTGSTSLLNVSRWPFSPPGLGFRQLPALQDRENGQEKTDCVEGTLRVMEEHP